MGEILPPGVSEPYDDEPDIGDYHALGERRLTDMARQIVEVRSAGMAGWLVATAVATISIAAVAWMLIFWVWPADAELTRLQDRLNRAQRSERQAQAALQTITEAHEQLKTAQEKLAAQVEETASQRAELQSSKDELEATLVRERNESKEQSSRKKKRSSKKRRR